MSEKYINIDNIGNVLFSVNERSKRIRLSIKSNGEIVVSYPPSVNINNALKFVVSKSDWIIMQQTKVQAGLTIFSPETKFKTKFHSLTITKGKSEKVYNRVGNGIIQIFVPEGVNHEMTRIQEFVKLTLLSVMRWEAKIYLPKRLNELALKHGFKYEKLSIKNASTRWGSCSSANNINLNLHLMRLPDHLIDYVILHELVHTVEKNHSSKFWSALEKCYPNCRKANSEMKKYKTQSF